MMHRYWWCRAELDESHREVEVDGPVWTPAAYYGIEDAQKNLLGVDFDPTKTKRHWAKARKGDFIPTFVPAGTFMQTCGLGSFQTFTSPFLDQAVSFEIAIGDDAYVTFRPERFLDLFDYEKSEYRQLSGSTVLGIKKIFLKSAPPEDLWYFGLAGDFSLQVNTIVSNRFKERYDDMKCTGLRFLPVYLDDDCAE